METSPVRFENLTVNHGPLLRFAQRRPEILTQVVGRSLKSIDQGNEELLLGEALYSERIRMKRDRGNWYTRVRKKKDRALWSKVQSGLLETSSHVDRHVLIEQVLAHYTDEISGNYDPKVYQFAIRAVPFFFNWLLNAASVKKILPWGLTESLSSSLKIVGEVPALQKLSQRGTILLVPTHQSHVDSVLIGYLIYLMQLPPFAYGAGLNLFSNPLLSYFMSRLGAYTVDRQKSSWLYKQSLKNYSTEILKEGVHSIFFPGGGRCRSGAIESKLKLGLLGTALEAQLENHLAGKSQPQVYVVPMVMSYHFVLEASSLIEDYLAESGRHRFIMMDDEAWQPRKVLNFFWKLFSSQSGITIRVGKPLDVFGNFVDEEGRSLGPNGTTVDPIKWLTSAGKLQPDLQRDQEYTRELGTRLVERYHRENTVLTSHLAAFVFFQTLRKQYRDLDLYRFLRISLSQRTLTLEKFFAQAERFHGVIRRAADQGELYLSDELLNSNTQAWVEDGIRNLGLLHDHAVLKTRDDTIWSEDMNLLFYYQNRLTGYGFENASLG